MSKNLGEMALEDYIKENKRREKFQKKGSQGVKPSKTLLVSGINLDATEVDLFKFFSEKGTLIECQLKKDQFQRSLGKAKVTYDWLEDSEKAFKELNGAEYKGQLLQIRYFSEKKPEIKDNKFNRKTKFEKDHRKGDRKQNDFQSNRRNDHRDNKHHDKHFKGNHKRFDSRRK